jgi:hypothetical protein
MLKFNLGIVLHEGRPNNLFENANSTRADDIRICFCVVQRDTLGKIYAKISGFAIYFYISDNCCPVAIIITAMLYIQIHENGEEMDANFYPRKPKSNLPSEANCPVK